MWAGSLVPRWTPFSQRADSSSIPAGNKPGVRQVDDVTGVMKLVSTTSCMQMMWWWWVQIFSPFSRFDLKNKNLSTGWSSASAPIGPTGCWGTSDPQRSEGSERTKARGKSAQTARDQWAHFHSLPEHEHRLESTRPKRFGGSPNRDRRMGAAFIQRFLIAAAWHALLIWSIHFKHAKTEKNCKHILYERGQYCVSSSFTSNYAYLPAQQSAASGRRPVSPSRQPTALVCSSPYTQKRIQLQRILYRFNGEQKGPSASPPSPPVGAAAGRHHIFSSGQTEARQVQEVFDHLTFDGNIQGRVGVEAVEKQTSETPSAFMRTGVCLSPRWYVDLQNPGF